jgi:hypothetical protein
VVDDIVVLIIALKVDAEVGKLCSLDFDEIVLVSVSLDALKLDDVMMENSIITRATPKTNLAFMLALVFPLPQI